MNKSIIILCVILLVGVVGLGCLPSKPAATSAISAKDTEQDAEISKIKSSITTLDEGKASKSSVTDLSDRVSKINQGTAPDLSQYYTKSQVDSAVSQAVTNAINALKVEKPWATSSSSTGGTSQTGSVTFATIPVSIPQILSDSSASAQSSYYTMKIVNNSSQWQYVKPIINLNLASSYSSTVINKIRIVMSSGSCNLVGTADKDNGKSGSIAYDSDNSIFSVSPPVNTSATSMVIMPIGGCNGTGEFQVGSGQTIDILIQITSFGTVDTRIWNISNSISTRSL